MHLLPLLPLLASLARASLTYKGVDWSSLLIEEEAGHTYKTTSGITEALEKILVASGVNTVRQRIWVDPSNSDYDLAYNLQLAARAHAAGLKIYLDFHFSNTWADPTDQATPSEWASYDITDLTWALYNYTLATMNSFQSAEIPLAIVSIGNEITDGLLYPLGDMSDSGGAYNAASLLHSAAWGIKDSDLSAQPLIMVHLDNGWDWATQEWWYETILGEGPFLETDFDVHSVSYYPFYNSEATLASLKTSLTDLKALYGKEVMVVETNWPTSCPDPAYAFPSDTTSIPLSAAGQTTWMKDVAAEITAAGGNGLFYWEPAWIDNPNLGSSCANNLMVSSSGEALSSLAGFASI